MQRVRCSIVSARRLAVITALPLVVALPALVGGCATGQGSATGPDPLPSWNDTPARRSILDFVANASNERHQHHIPVSERIAVFDNDGTLWSEQPAYFQLLFAIDRVRALAPQNPQWRTTQPFQAAIEGDMQTLAQSGEKGIAQMVMATHAGMTTDEFDRVVRDWIATARHPDTGRPYTEMVFQPMLELLAHLRDRGFKTYIVSGGGVEFIRVFSEEIYGVPPEQVIGSTIRTEFEMTADGPVIRRLPELDFIDDKAGKPVAINRVIGRRPAVAVGNSDGDLQMLQWTAARQGASLCVLIHHTDDRREWAYDRDSHIGRLDEALDEAQRSGWTVVNMARDWKTVFPRRR